MEKIFGGIKNGKEKDKKEKIDGGKLLLGCMTGGVSLLFTGIHEDPKHRKRKKGISYRDDRWCDRASWF